MCFALSGCCLIVVADAHRVPGALVHAYTKGGPVEVMTTEVMSEPLSGLVNKGTDSSPQAGARVNLDGEGERKEGDSRGEPVTFDPLVEVSLQPSQLCLPLPSASSSSLLKHRTLALCSLPQLTFTP